MPRLSLERFAGQWHEIARLPIRAQRRCEGEVTATYRLRDDGTVAVHNACRNLAGRIVSVDGIARIPDPLRAPARWQVSFAPAWLRILPWVWADYWVLALDDAFRWALVGEPRRRHLWILARDPRMDYHLFEDIKAIARRMGYDLAPLIVSPARAG